jgi:DNA modification methylase
MRKSPKKLNYRRAVKAVGDPLDKASLNSHASRAKRRKVGPIRIEMIGLNALCPDPANPRRHSPQQTKALANNIRKHGFTNPILVTHDNVIVAGHGRFEASKLAGLVEIPIIRLNLTKAQAKAHNIWDNRSSDLSRFDDQLLGLAMQELVELDIDIEETGFSIAEVDLLIDRLSGEQKEPVDEGITAASGPAITKLGDVWSLGGHRIICADAQNARTYSQLMGGKLAHAVFTDVPYNLAGRQISGKGKVCHSSFKMAAGEMSPEKYRVFLRLSIKQMVQNSVDGSLHYHCIDWRHLTDIQAASENVYRELLNICVWVKPNGGMGSLYRSRHEFVLVFKNGKKRHRNNVELGRYGRNRTNVWEYAGGTSLPGRVTDEGNLLSLHPTVKPVQMIIDAILDCTARDEIVLDSFLGSGSTLIAAERAGRICYGVEIDPLYVDTAVRRWQQHTGRQAVHAITGKKFKTDDKTLERSAKR